MRQNWQIVDKVSWFAWRSECQNKIDSYRANIKVHPQYQKGDQIQVAERRVRALGTCIPVTILVWRRKA